MTMKQFEPTKTIDEMLFDMLNENAKRNSIDFYEHTDLLNQLNEHETNNKRENWQ